jgi:type II secretory pathway component PulL
MERAAVRYWATRRAAIGLGALLIVVIGGGMLALQHINKYVRGEAIVRHLIYADSER